MVGDKSYAAQVVSGVPQGSVLRPCLLFYYTNVILVGLNSTMRLCHPVINFGTFPIKVLGLFLLASFWCSRPFLYFWALAILWLQNTCFERNIWSFLWLGRECVSWYGRVASLKIQNPRHIPMFGSDTNKLFTMRFTHFTHNPYAHVVVIPAASVPVVLSGFHHMLHNGFCQGTEAVVLNKTWECKCYWGVKRQFDIHFEWRSQIRRLA